MNKFSKISEEECFSNFKSLCESYRDHNSKWNEANTRYHFIDKLLNECLGWPTDEFDLENSQAGEYADYIIGNPGKLIVEAKKEGLYFDLPPTLKNNPIQSIATLCRSSPSCKAAIEQVQRYCFARGVQYAAVCNGSQLISFVAIRIGEPPLSGRALVIDGLDSLKEHFGLVWRTLSPAGIAEGRLYRLLTSGNTATLPPKPSSRLSMFPQIRYQSDVQATLRDFSELLIEDIVNTSELEQQFYEECYCDTGALSRDALLSKQILSARYAALFPPSEESPRVHSIKTKGESPSVFNDEMLQEALARRPIVLIGDVGVGKTSFIKNLFLRKATDETKESILLFIDFGTQATLTNKVNDFVIDEIEHQLFSKYGVDISEENIVNGIYNIDVKKYKNSVFYKAATTDEEKNKLVLSMLVEKVRNKPEHLKNVIEHLAKARKKQVVIVIDNADQRNQELQQEAFLIAQEFARGWNALTFISLRPQTFFQSTKSGALAAYPNKVFTISPPRPELVIEKRLQFALRVCEGKVAHSRYVGLNIRVGSMTLFLRSLLESLRSNREIKEFLSNMTGGNVREIVEFVKKFIGSPNVDAEKIIDIMTREGRYYIPIHEFSKAAILGDFAHYNPTSSLAANLFDVYYPDEREHFLSSLILFYMDSDFSQKDKDAFISANAIVTEMQSQRFSQQQTENSLRKLTNKKLIETTQRITFDESDNGLIGEMPRAFRLTSIGLYHIARWLCSFSYLDGMLFDTPIFDETVFQNVILRQESFAISDRLSRTLEFRRYLSEVWNRSTIEVPYFDWNKIVERDEAAFLPIIRAVDRKN